jgi:hypothetical protein
MLQHHLQHVQHNLVARKTLKTLYITIIPFYIFVAKKSIRDAATKTLFCAIFITLHQKKHPNYFLKIKIEENIRNKSKICAYF